MIITPDVLDSWGTCKRNPGERYSDEALSELLVGREGLTPLEVCDEESIPVEDRLWVLFRPEVLGDRFQGLLEAIVERAIRRSLGRYGAPDWEAWAERWLSGEDRSAEAAWAARDAAAEEMWAAWTAARALAAARGAMAWEEVARTAAWTAARALAAAAWSAWPAGDEERRLQLAETRAALVVTNAPPEPECDGKECKREINSYGCESGPYGMHSEHYGDDCTDECIWCGESPEPCRVCPFRKDSTVE